jgi:hypothetical protein
MNKIITILILAILAVQVQAAEGRRTAAVLGFAAGALTGWIANDQINKAPAPQVVRYREPVRQEPVYQEPVRERVIERTIIVERAEPAAKEYVIIDGKAYEIVRSR